MSFVAGSADQRSAVMRRAELLGNRVLKVDHAGECGAAHIYRGQLLACRFRDANLRRNLHEFRCHEERHRAIFRAELERRGLRPCVFASLCSLGGFTLGVVTGLCGVSAIAMTTVAVERVVLRHLGTQLRDLRTDDPEACRAIRSILADEEEHHAHGLQQSSKAGIWIELIGAIVSAATESVIWLGMRQQPEGKVPRWALMRRRQEKVRGRGGD